MRWAGALRRSGSALTAEPGLSDFVALQRANWGQRGRWAAKPSVVPGPISRGGRLAATVWADLARAAALEQRWSEATERLDRALESNPGHIEALYLRGVFGLHAGRMDDAESDLSAAVEAGLPRSVAADAWFRLARLALGRGDRQLALHRLANCLAA